MAIDMREEMRRPAGILLAFVAALGWGIALYLAWTNASLRRGHREEIQLATTARSDLQAELDAQRKASGCGPAG
jgi:hypothetical protein